MSYIIKFNGGSITYITLLASGMFIKHKNVSNCNEQFMCSIILKIMKRPNWRCKTSTGSNV